MPMRLSFKPLEQIWSTVRISVTKTLKISYSVAVDITVAEAPSFVSLVLPLTCEEGLAAGDVREPGFDGLAVHVHGEVVKRR